jgi:hypothetical protein
MPREVDVKQLRDELDERHCRTRSTTQAAGVLGVLTRATSVRRKLEWPPQLTVLGGAMPGGILGRCEVSRTI